MWSTGRDRSLTVRDFALAGRKFWRGPLRPLEPWGARVKAMPGEAPPQQVATQAAAGRRWSPRRPSVRGWSPGGWSARQWGLAVVLALYTGSRIAYFTTGG